jgi:ABC-type branched-subunit amino acid transport system ATPase component
MPALTAEKITAGYGRVPVIHDISLTADPGTVTTIVGPNGAGKSTFAKALLGVVRPSAGRVWVEDAEITRLPGHLIPRRGLAYVPQNDNVFPTLSVRENLEIGGYAKRKNSDARITEILGIFPDLKEAHAKKAGQLSGGQQNLLAMARALMVEPKVIVLDEPTAGLSPAYTSIVWQQIERIAAGGTAALVVEQNVDRALAHAQFVYIFVAGRNHIHGPVADIAKLDLGAIFLGHDQAPHAAVQ